MHDCLHGTLFRRRMTNRAVGEVLGAVTGIDFTEFRRRHLKHHRNYGRSDDPQGFHYLGLEGMGRTAYLRHLLRPLIGLNLTHVLPESVLHPANLGRMLRDGRILLFVMCQVMIVLLVTGGGRYLWLVALPPLSAATFGLFFSQVRGIAEHGLRDPDRRPGFVRSHQGRLLDRLLLCDLNFNLHDEHHSHPGVPSCHLPALSRASGRLVEQNGMWHTVKALAS